MNVNDVIDEFYELYDDQSYESAIALLETTTASDEDRSWRLMKMAECYYEMRRYNEAIASAKGSLNYQPEYPLALWILANAEYYVDRKDEALVHFEQILILSDEKIGEVETQYGIAWAKSLRSDILLKLADTYYMQEDDAKACAWYRAYLDYDGSNGESFLSSRYIADMKEKLSEIC